VKQIDLLVDHIGAVASACVNRGSRRPAGRLAYLRQRPSINRSEPSPMSITFMELYAGSYKQP